MMLSIRSSRRLSGKDPNLCSPSKSLLLSSPELQKLAPVDSLRRHDIGNFSGGRIQKFQSKNNNPPLIEEEFQRIAYDDRHVLLPLHSLKTMMETTLFLQKLCETI